MKFWVEENGQRVCYQSVVRNGKTYYRHCASTMYYSTEDQEKVRLTLAKAAVESGLRDESRNQLLNNVKRAVTAHGKQKRKPGAVTEHIKFNYPQLNGIIEVENGKE